MARFYAEPWFYVFLLSTVALLLIAFYVHRTIARELHNRSKIAAAAAAAAAADANAATVTATDDTASDASDVFVPPRLPPPPPPMQTVTFRAGDYLFHLLPYALYLTQGASRRRKAHDQL